MEEKGRFSIPSYERQKVVRGNPVSIKVHEQLKFEIFKISINVRKFKRISRFSGSPNSNQK